MHAGSERDRATIVQRALVGTRFERVRWVAETGSTNADLLAEAAEATGPCPEQVLLADLQTAGRGRRNRVWTAPAGSSLMVSLLLRGIDIAEGFWAVGAVALAGAEAASEAAGVAVSLKWPNDLLIDDKKLAGILAQRQGDALVVGMGLNVRWHADMPAEFAAHATSLDRHSASQQPIDRVALACDVLQRTARWLDAPSSELRDAWVERCSTLQKHVRIELEQGDEVGLAVDVDTSGALVVDQAGTCVMFHVGDVVHLRPNNAPLSG